MMSAVLTLPSFGLADSTQLLIALKNDRLEAYPTFSLRQSTSPDRLKQ